jgi:hypothetical protein
MRRLSTVLVALLAILCARTIPASAIEMPTFGKSWCKGTSVHDYRGPLNALPPVQHPPEQLPFGPPKLNLYSTAFSPVIVGEGGFGYGFFDETYRDRTLHLNWELTARVSRISSRGETLRTVRSRTVRVTDTSNPDEIDLWLRVPADPALYRYDLEFHDLQSGELLGTYSEYLRVVRRTFHARIAVNHKAFHPGQDAFARIENRGSEWVEFGVSYDVQRFEGGHWGPSLLGERTWPAVAIVMSGGGSGFCMRYRIPPDAHPGRYRFTKGLGSLDRKQGGVRTAVFRVRPGRSRSTRP